MKGVVAVAGPGEGVGVDPLPRLRCVKVMVPIELLSDRRVLAAGELGCTAGYGTWGA